MTLILEPDEAYEAAKADPAVRQELDVYLKDSVGRSGTSGASAPGGAQIYLIILMNLSGVAHLGVSL